MLPVLTLRVDCATFGGETTCLGTQLAKVVAAIAPLCPELAWYVADAAPVPLSEAWPQGFVPVPVGDSAQLIRLAESVGQLLSGVFAGVPATVKDPAFRDGMWTEDPDDSDPGSALVEVRAFDTTYLLIATRDEALLEALAKKFAPD